MKAWKRGFLIGCVIFLVGIIGGMIYINAKMTEVFVSEPMGGEEIKVDIPLMVNETLQETENDVLNIALFGVDCRDTFYSGCRSDVMMIISYFSHTNEILVTSIPRDTYVDILGYGLDKINHAYAFGGPELSIQTINRNFDLNIEHFVTVDFWAVEKLIDAVEGVKVEVSEEELSYVNSYLTGLNNISPEQDIILSLSEPGMQILNGRQAVAYMRIRYVGNGDFERMSRQREVMASALDKTRNLSLTQLIQFVDELIPTVRTNLSKTKCIELITQVMLKGIPSMTEYQLPSVSEATGKRIDNIYYFVPHSLTQSVANYHQLLYPQQTYEPTQTVSELNEKLQVYYK